MDLPPMQKPEFIRKLILIFLISIGPLQAQGERIYNLYTSNKFAEIEMMLVEGQIVEQDWKNFCEILFIEDLDIALIEYISLYNRSTNTQLKNVVVDRISQYYYAKGLYDSAERILHDEEFRRTLFSMNIEKISFGVQLGAFSTQENAARGKDKYSGKIDDIKIIKKSSGGKILFVVVAGQFDNKQKANEYLQRIKDDYGIKGLVIQF
jgi:hypothetical protein